MNVINSFRKGARYTVYAISGILGGLISYHLLAKPIYRAALRSKRKYLKRMEIEKKIPQWIIVYGDPDETVSSYLKALKRGGLRVCFVTNSVSNPDTEIKPDKVFGYDQVTELSEFMENRHIKIFINALPLSALVPKDDKAWELLRNVTGLIENITKNMRVNGGGCLITLEPKVGSSIQLAAGAYCAELAKELAKQGKQIYVQKVSIPAMPAAEKLIGKSIDGIGIDESI